jgi:hypothetical protein
MAIILESKRVNLSGIDRDTTTGFDGIKKELGDVDSHDFSRFRDGEIAGFSSGKLTRRGKDRPVKKGKDFRDVVCTPIS